MKYKEIIEAETNPTEFSVDVVLRAISACQDHFNEDFLFHGNCGSFAIALAKWMSERFAGTNVGFGFMAPVVLFGSTRATEVPMIENAVDYNHVFAVAISGGKNIYFDGTGVVDKEKMRFWYKDTLKWYKECEFDYGPGRGRVVAAVGSVKSEDSIMCVESGTDATCDWTEFFEYLQNIRIFTEQR